MMKMIKTLTVFYSQLGPRCPPGYPGQWWGLWWTSQPCCLRGGGFYWKVALVEGENF